MSEQMDVVEVVARCLEPNTFFVFDKGYTARNAIEEAAFLNAERKVKATRRRVARALTALDAAGYTVVLGWQPIETAPRDGTHVLVVMADNPALRAYYDDGTWFPHLAGPYSNFCVPLIDKFAPTHWMPLPAAPKATPSTGWIEWNGEGEPDLPGMTPIRPKYRGPADPHKGVRMVVGPLHRLGWSHDGGPDDIVAYQVCEVEG